nr:TRAP transporter small permease [Wenxinia marina]
MRPLVTLIARVMALLGGLVLVALVILTCLSVIGRGLVTLGHSDVLTGAAPGLAGWLNGTGVGPIPGDFELVEAGVAFAIFAFLPICQLRSGHATVDIFTNLMPGGIARTLVVFWEIVLALTLVLIAWRLYEGFSDKLRNGQTTFLLQFPVWWAYGASLIAASAAALVGVWCAAARAAETVTGRPIMPPPGEADH